MVEIHCQGTLRFTKEILGNRPDHEYMSAGELNSLENLGLVQRVPKSTCGVTLIYYLDDEKLVHIIPQDDDEFPLGQYSLTYEGEQLYQVINTVGNRTVLKIIE